jgi:hypothetical protein
VLWRLTVTIMCRRRLTSAEGPSMVVVQCSSAPLQGYESATGGSCSTQHVTTAATVR